MLEHWLRNNGSNHRNRLIQIEPSRTVTLLAFGDEWRKQKHLALSEPMQKLRDSALAAARAALGDTAFDAAWETGRTLTSEAALDLCAELFHPPVAGVVGR